MSMVNKFLTILLLNYPSKSPVLREIYAAHVVVFLRARGLALSEKL